MLLFSERGNPGKTARSRVENQQTQSMFDSASTEIWIELEFGIVGF